MDDLDYETIVLQSNLTIFGLSNNDYEYVDDIPSVKYNIESGKIIIIVDNEN